ncbi:MAG: hypothetical protein NTV88_02120 [Candidatus Micrarchaeota archaeon]|nr:hypothetical protein [Candidatus Micrarchaeota archaeon]
MKIVAMLLLCLLLVSPVNSLFLVGQGAVGDKIPILCEQQERVFVSSPNGQLQALSLDNNFQAEFAPTEAGPHTIQCGKETKVVSVVATQQHPPEAMRTTGDANVLILAVLSFSALALLAAVAVGRKFFTQTIFSKTVQAGRAHLYLKAGKKMAQIRIEDPVSFAHKGQVMKFSIPSLSAGKDWSWEYDIDAPEGALPASLVATEGGKKVSMLSRLLIEGMESEEGKKDSTGAAKLPKIKRKLAKAT